MTYTPEEKLKLARNPNTSVETLQVLATDENSHVRRRVARNLNTPVEILKVLATDKNYYVREEVVGKIIQIINLKL